MESTTWLNIALSVILVVCVLFGGYVNHVNKQHEREKKRSHGH